LALQNADLKLLTLFVAIAEAGGFAAAQAKVGLNLSTISNHMTTLETRLGVTLCRRGRGGFALTPEGKAVYEEAHRLLGAVGQFENRLRALRDHLAGEILVGLTENTLTDPQARLDRVFARFTDAAPGVRLTLVTRPPDDLLRDIVADKMALAIASFPKIVLGLDYHDLYSETQSFYCGAGHPLFDQDSVDLGDLRRWRLVARSYWGGRDLRQLAAAQPQAFVSDTEASARLILSGRYLGYLPAHFAAPLVGEGRLRCLCAQELTYQAPFQLAHAPHKRNDPITSLFCQLVKEELCPSRDGAAVL
jgi:DNA-binding transcriptional LysR family regulator